jgi:hypothetical protein
LVRPGDHVDVIAVLEVDGVDPLDPSRIQEITRSMTLVQDVLVLAVEQAPVAQPVAQSVQRGAPLSSRARAKDCEDRRQIVDAFDGEPSRAARAEATQERRVHGHLGRRSHRWMPRGIGVDALRPDSLQVTCRDQANQRPRHCTVIRIHRAPKLFARVRMFRARHAFPKTSLESSQISIRIVRHDTATRIDNQRPYPQPPPLPPHNSHPVAPARALARTLALTLSLPVPYTPPVTAADLISSLRLTPHPEGGHYGETWRHDENARHRVLGRDVSAGQRPQIIVAPYEWQAARSLGEWTLVGCTVSPAFEFERFELAPKDWIPGSAF